MFKKLSFFIFVFYVASAHSDARAQNPFPTDPVKADPITKTFDKIPFDKAFSVPIPMDDAESVTNVFAYEVEYRKWKSTDANVTDYAPGRRVRDIADASEPIKRVRFAKDPNSKSLIISFPALPPNFHFDFAIIRKPNGASLKTLRSFSDSLAKLIAWASPINLTKVEFDFYSFARSIDKKVYPGQPVRFLATAVWDINACCNIANQTCRDHADLMHCLYFKSGLDTAYKAIQSFTFAAAVTPVLANVAAVSALLVIEDMEIEGISQLNQMLTKGNAISYKNGRLSLKDLSGAEVNELDFKSRIDNFDTTILILKKLRKTLEELKIRSPANAAAINTFQDEVSIFQSWIETFKMRVQNNDNFINKAIAGNELLRYSEWYMNTTEIKELSTKSAFIFTPQIGLSLLGVRTNENKINYVPKINWGININFRPIDKSIPRKFLEKVSPWHYFSLYVGLTIGSFRDKQFDNLYNSTSLLLGPSFRINRSLYFSGGVSLYRQKKNNPLINKFEVTPGGYVSMLLDLDITNAVSAIRNVLFK